MARYLRILRVRAARNPFVASVIGRMPISMAPLAAVLLIQQVRGSYAIAGLVTGAYALGATVGTPVLGRLVDRFGQPRIIGWAGSVSAILLAGLALAATGGLPDVALLALAAAAGLIAPPLVAVMRGTWRVALPGDADRRAAYALDAVAVEFVFVIGLLAAGTFGYSRAEAVRAWRPEPHPVAGDAVARSPLAYPGVRIVLLATLLVALAFAHVDLSIAATAKEALHDPGKVGLLFACIAGGSATGGLWYGTRHWSRPERLRLPIALAAVTAGLAGVAVLLGGVQGVVRTPPLPALAVLLGLAGMCIAPALIAISNLVDALAPRSRLSEAQAWVSTAYTGGGAAGTAVAGLLVDKGGPGRGFLGAFTLMLLGAVVAAVGQPLWRSADRVPVAAELPASVP
jgi:MFS family permease